MDINVSRNANPYACYQPVAAKRDQRTATKQSRCATGGNGEGTTSLFDKYLNARKPISNTSVVDVGYEHGLPLCQLFDDYRAWKQDRQDVAMPDADSSLDEKLTYVCEHYADASDGLSLFDALSTPKELGVISQIEYAWALGGPLIRIPITEMENPSFTIINDGERGDRTRWDIPFMTSPLVSFHSLDDIFNWLEEFRKEDHPLSVSLEEARRMGITRL